MRRKNFLFNFIFCFTFIFLLFASSSNLIFASTNTEERTENDLKILDSINVTDTVKKAALATPKVNESEKIYDFADLLDDEEESTIYTEITSFIANYNMDMVVVTISENNKSSAMSYADDFYDYNYFGVGSTRDGVLLLIDMDNRVVWISTTGEAILMYNDSRIDNILDKVQPYLSDSSYYSAVTSFITKCSDYAEKGIPSGNSDIEKIPEFNSASDVFYFVMSIALFPTIITVVIILIGVFSHKNVKKAVFAEAYLNKGTLDIYDRKDLFIRKSVTSTRIASDSHSGGGGSSTHSSSSGSSHGGGGRSF